LTPGSPEFHVVSSSPPHDPHVAFASSDSSSESDLPARSAVIELQRWFQGSGARLHQHQHCRSGRGSIRSGSNLLATHLRLLIICLGFYLQALKSITYTLPPPNPSEVRVRFLLGSISLSSLPANESTEATNHIAPADPADINVLQGVYPSKPKKREGIAAEPVQIPGNEGLAVVESVGEQAEGIVKEGAWGIVTSMLYFACCGGG
jgi:hypothetical protein